MKKKMLRYSAKVFVFCVEFTILGDVRKVRQLYVVILLLNVVNGAKCTLFLSPYFLNLNNSTNA